MRATAARSQVCGEGSGQENPRKKIDALGNIPFPRFVPGIIAEKPRHSDWSVSEAKYGDSAGVSVDLNLKFLYALNSLGTVELTLVRNTILTVLIAVNQLREVV